MFEIRLKCKVVHVLELIYLINKFYRDAWDFKVAFDENLPDVFKDVVQVNINISFRLELPTMFDWIIAK